MITGYFKLETLKDEVKVLNKIKVGAIVQRLDCTAQAGNYKGLEAFISPKGQMFFYLSPCREVVKTHAKRYAEFCLTSGKSLNFGSLYKFIDFPNFAYSYPNKKPFIGTKRDPNPLYSFGNDLYLIIKSPDYSTFEILIFEGGRNLAEHYLQSLIDGNFDAEIQTLRAEAKPLFEYTGLNSANSKM